jgi:hypothetical protein
MQHVTTGGAILLSNVLLQKQFRTFYLLSFLVICVLCSLPLPSASAATVTVAWDENIETDVIGYKFYYGTSSGNYQPMEGVDVENNTSCSVSGLDEGTTYYFAVKAYNDKSLESDYSEELVYTIPITTITQHTLDVTIVGNGSVSVEPDQAEYDLGQLVTITATADPGWEFSDWEGDITGTQNPVIVTMNADMYLTSIFTELVQVVTYTITTSAGTNGTISPTSATVNAGDSQTFTITPDTGYQVEDVLVDGISAGQVAEYSFSDVKSNHNISASFEPIDGGELTLSVNAYKIKGDKYAKLTLSGDASMSMDVYRNGRIIAQSISGRAYTHGPFSQGKPATYQVCAAGTLTCSNEVTVSW